MSHLVYNGNRDEIGITDRDDRQIIRVPRISPQRHQEFRVSESLSSVPTAMDAEEFRKAGYQAVDQSNVTVLQR